MIGFGLFNGKLTVAEGVGVSFLSFCDKEREAAVELQVGGGGTGFAGGGDAEGGGAEGGGAGDGVGGKDEPQPLRLVLRTTSLGRVPQVDTGDASQADENAPLPQPFSISVLLSSAVLDQVGKSEVDGFDSFLWEDEDEGKETFSLLEGREDQERGPRGIWFDAVLAGFRLGSFRTSSHR